MPVNAAAAAATRYVLQKLEQCPSPSSRNSGDPLLPLLLIVAAAAAAFAGARYVMKKPEYAPPKQPRNAADPMQLLDYRCHVPPAATTAAAGEQAAAAVIRTNYPKQVGWMQVSCILIHNDMLEFCTYTIAGGVIVQPGMVSLSKGQLRHCLEIFGFRTA